MKLDIGSVGVTKAGVRDSNEHRLVPYSRPVCVEGSARARAQGAALFDARAFDVRGRVEISGAHLARSPRGKVPLLTDGEFMISESIAILAYLERRYPERALFGVTDEETGTIWCHVSEYTAYVDEAVEAFILPVYFDRVARERLLERSEYLAGATLTAADFVVFPHVQSVLRAASEPAANALELPFLPLGTRHPALAAWLARITQMPGYERTYPANWRAAPNP